MDLELCIDYEGSHKLIIFYHNTSFEDFKHYLKTLFGIQNKDIKLIDKKRNAEIISSLSFKEEYEILLFPIDVEVINSNEEVYSQQDVSNASENNNYVEFNDLIGKKFQENELQYKLNKWANGKCFRLVYCEGKQTLKTETKRSLKCNIKGCEYKLILKSDENGDNYQIYEKLSKKYILHSNKLFISILKSSF